MKKTTYTFCLLFLLGICPPLMAQNPEGPERWEQSIQAFEEKDRQDPPPAGVILFTGSSSIVMYKDLAEHFPNQKVLNRGFGGSQFSDLLYYADRVISPYKPSKVFIYEGDNDIGTGKKPKKVFKKARKLRRKIAKALPGVPVVFISPKPSIARWALKEEYEQLNGLLENYAAETENTEFADVWSAMLDENGKVYQHIFLEDNLHMNKAGYEIWRSVLSPYVEEGQQD